MTTAEISEAADKCASAWHNLTDFERRLIAIGYVEGFLIASKQTLQEVQDEFKQGSKVCQKS